MGIMDHLCIRSIGYQKTNFGSKFNAFQVEFGSIGGIKVRSVLYTVIAFLPVSECAALKFSQASIKPEKTASFEANAP